MCLYTVSLERRKRNLILEMKGYLCNIKIPAEVKKGGGVDGWGGGRWSRIKFNGSAEWTEKGKYLKYEKWIGKEKNIWDAC